MAPEKKNPVLVIVALMVFLPVLALSKMRGVGHGSGTAGDGAADGFSPILIIAILLVVVAFALAGSYLLKK